MSKKKRKHIPLPLLPPGITAIDTHCHLDMDAYDQDRQAVIENSLAAGIGTIITIGIDLESSRAALALAEQYSHIYCSIGVHPHNITGLTDQYYKELTALAAHPKVVAYGEIGMDRVRCQTPEDLQQEHFRRQVQIAKQLNLPLIIHDREAHQTVMEILESEAPFPAGGIMHCFSGDRELARQVLDLGFLISIPGVVTFNNAEMLQEVVRTTPLNCLVLETDGPYLSPVPRRGKRNEPANILYIAEKIAQLKEIELAEVVSCTTENARKIFRLQNRKGES